MLGLIDMGGYNLQGVQAIIPLADSVHLFETNWGNGSLLLGTSGGGSGAGQFNLYTDDAVSGNNSENIGLITGSATGGGNSGDLKLVVGSAVGGGTNGSIILQNASKVDIQSDIDLNNKKIQDVNEIDGVSNQDLLLWAQGTGGLQLYGPGFSYLDSDADLEIDSGTGSGGDMTLNVSPSGPGDLNVNIPNGGMIFSGGFGAGSEINFSSRKLINIVDPANPQDAATKNYVDTLSGALKKDGSNSPTADIDWGAKHITNLADPSPDSYDAVNMHTADGFRGSLGIAISGANQSNLSGVAAIYERTFVGPKKHFAYIDFSFQIVTGNLGIGDLLTVTLGGFTIDTSLNLNGTDTSNPGREYYGMCDWFQAGQGWKKVSAHYEDSTHIRFFEIPGTLLTDALTPGSSIQCKDLKIPIVGF
jgi:hypothetical protein